MNAVWGFVFGAITMFMVVLIIFSIKDIFDALIAQKVFEEIRKQNKPVVNRKTIPRKERTQADEKIIHPVMEY